MNKESTANIESLKPTIVLVLDNLAELYRAQGQYAKAKLFTIGRWRSWKRP